VWLWLRESKTVLLGILGGRVYAAYGGVFVVLSILWGWLIDKKNPDTFDLIGGLFCLIGVVIIMWWPRALIG
jgi:small multidrug resistance family-3 protein